MISRAGSTLNLPLTAFGDLRTAELSPIFQGSFEYTVDNTELTTNTVTNGGTVTQASAMAVVGTSTTTNSTAKLKSRRHARYRAGLGGVQRFTTLFTAPVAATEIYAGILDEAGSSVAFKNGLAVGYTGTVFGFQRFSGDTLTTIAQADWDDPLDGTGASGMTLDHTKLNIWYIQFGYLGALGPILWFVGTDNIPYKVHTMQITGTLTEPTSLNPNYNFTLWANNKATTSDVGVKCASYAYFTEGKAELIELQQPQQSSGEISKAAVTTEIAILTIRNKATYQSKVNFIDIVLEHVGASIEAANANNLGSIRLVRNATLGGTPSYSDINTSDSVVDMDTAGTTVTGGKDLLDEPLAGKNDKISEDILQLKIILGPGETITLAGTSAGSATINGSLLWKELF